MSYKTKKENPSALEQPVAVPMWANDRPSEPRSGTKWIDDKVVNMSRDTELYVSDLLEHLGVPVAHRNRGLTQGALRAVLNYVALPPHELIGP